MVSLLKVLMEHPPKQGLKPEPEGKLDLEACGFNGTSTKTRIETTMAYGVRSSSRKVLMEHPPKQGLKRPFSFRKSTTGLLF